MKVTDRLVVVRADRLDDLCELARAAADQLPDTNPLVSALRGAVAEVRIGSVMEP